MGFTWVAVLFLWQEPIDLRRVVEPGPTAAERRGVAAQASFERERRFRLPATGGGGGRCDERIGRFCYWYDDRDTTLPSEPLSLLDLRMRLLGTLREAAAEEPESAWLTGQLVRYLVEHGERDSAVVAASRCGASIWWCEAVLGFALHADERDEEADTAFRRATRAMPDSLRCAWTDWTRILEPGLANRYGALDCAARLELSDTVLWLAKPLLSRPGNVIRSELLSRRVVAALGNVSRSPYAISWGRDMEELVLRYGWSRRFSVVDHRSWSLEGPSVVGHQRAPAYPFLPDLAHPDDGAPWVDLLGADRPRARFSPGYIDRFESTDAFQLARFPRGDSSIVVGAIDPGSRFGRDSRYDVALAAGAGPENVAVERHDSTARLAGLQVAVAGEVLAASVELSAVGGRQFLRGREYYAPIDREAPIVLSDLLLLCRVMVCRRPCMMRQPSRCPVIVSRAGRRSGSTGRRRAAPATRPSWPSPWRRPDAACSAGSPEGSAWSGGMRPSRSSGPSQPPVLPPRDVPSNSTSSDSLPAAITSSSRSRLAVRRPRWTGTSD